MPSTRVVVLHNYTAPSERDGRAEDSGAPQISIAICDAAPDALWKMMHCPSDEAVARIMPGLLLEGR